MTKQEYCIACGEPAPCRVHVVTEGMVAAGGRLAGGGHFATDIYLTMAALLPPAPQRPDHGDNLFIGRGESPPQHNVARYWCERAQRAEQALASGAAKETPMWALYLAEKRRVAALEAEKAHLKELLGAECPALAKELENEIYHLQRENRSLAYQCRVATGVLLQIHPSGCLVPQYLVDPSDIPALTPQYEKEVESYLAWLRGAEIAEKAQWLRGAEVRGAADATSITPAPLVAPTRPDGTLAPEPKPWSPPKSGGDPRRVGG